MLTTLRKYIWKVRQLPNGSFNTFSVIKNYFAWKNLLKPGRSTLSDGMPWMTFDAIDFLKKNLNKKMHVFEYGMGGSTIFLANHVLHVTSVEHDKEWFESANKFFREKGVSNCKPLFFSPEKEANIEKSDSSDPAIFTTGDQSWRSFSFFNYVKSIEQFPDNYFDLVIVDGRSRPACLKACVNKIKSGGWILLDNADRPHYRRAIDELITHGFVDEVRTFGPTSYSEDFTQTLIRRKL